MTFHLLLLLNVFASVFLLLKLLIKPVPRRLAGPVLIAVTTATAFFILADHETMRFGLIAAAILTLIFGTIDDRKNLGPAAQFFGQILIALSAVASGWSISYVTNPTGGLIYLPALLGALLAALWLIILINAVNWLDGSDGLAGSVGVVAFLTLVTVSILPATRDNLTLSLSLIGLGGLAAFLVWNWPPAKIYLGTAGSWWLGLYLGLTAITGQGKIALTILVLGLPLLDAAYVIVRRLLSGRAPWRGDVVSHFHHRLRVRQVSPRAICLIAAALSALLGAGALLLTVAPDTCPNFNEATVHINDQPLSVGLAVTPDQQSRGLGGCPEVPAGHGLYFSFSQKRQTSFWMKNMLIPIDIVWIADGQVAGIAANVPPPDDLQETNLPLYYPPQGVNAVLELSSGAADQWGIQPGSRIFLTD